MNAVVEQKKYPVFVSYAMEDGQEYAENLKNVLEGIGLPTFVAHKTIPVSYRNPSARMLQAVDECQYFVLVLTPAACKSVPVQKEITQAISGGKTIIACKRCDIPRNLIPNDFIKNDVQRLRFENAQSLAKQVVHVLVENTQGFLEESGINRVFLSRHDPEYAKELERCFLNKTADEILMLGLSLRDWFGREGADHKYANLLEAAVRNGTKFKVLLVDPTSETARERALVEREKDFEDDEKLVKSELYRDMKRVMKWLKEPQVDVGTKNLMKTNVETRFYDSLLSVYVIKTADYMFIEQYHTGKLGILHGKKIDDPDDWCHGGYVPVFLVKNTSDFGRLMSDHFANIWEKSKANTLEKTLAKVNALEANPKNFRMEQFVESTKKKCTDLCPE
jgi:hypothetical protein